MRNYIAVKVGIRYVTDKRWELIKRPVGMSGIIYMAPKYPTDKTIKKLTEALGKGEVCLIFNPDDTLRFIGKGVT